jgi:VanZ family protein
MSRAAKFAFAYGLIIIAISSIPGSNLPELSLLSNNKLIHLVEYLIFAILIHRAVRGEVSPIGNALVLTLIIGICYGGLDEL